MLSNEEMMCIILGCNILKPARILWESNKNSLIFL